MGTRPKESSNISRCTEKQRMPQTKMGLFFHFACIMKALIYYYHMRCAAFRYALYILRAKIINKIWFTVNLEFI